ncbi:MAG TPA: hypothetical protein VNA16_10280, partial [Abditibacteriaceae bacterium]|nr:hypothetical protein [Abditibacteriaceae bacterium]
MVENRPGLHDRRFPVRFFVATTLLAAVPLAVMWWRHQTQRPEPPYVFPSQELAALDRVVQARFAVVPTKNFGVDRIGSLHELFVPETQNEKAVIAALRRHHQNVAFYVISRRTFTKERGPVGYYPVQGPVYMTGNKPPPVSRRHPYGNRVVAQTWDKPPENEDIVANADGTPLPHSTPEAGLPEGWRLIKMAAPVLEAASRKPPQVAVGANFKLGEWQ